MTTSTATTQAALTPDNTVRCHVVLVPVSSPLELNIDQLRESAVIKPCPPPLEGGALLECEGRRV